MSQPDLNAYVFGELPESERAAVEAWLSRDAGAALEVERLRTTLGALRSLPAEEPPRRIAFVSDKVFEPRWYQRWWRAAGGLVMASAMLSAAIVAHGVLARPVAPAAGMQVAQVSQQDIARQVEAEVARRLDTAVTKAVAQVRGEAQVEQQRVVAAALSQAEKGFALERQADRAAVEATVDTMRKEMKVMVKYLAMNQAGGAQ